MRELFCVMVFGVMALSLGIAHAADEPIATNVIATAVSGLPASSTNTTAGAAFRVRPADGVAVAPSFKLAGAGTSAVAFDFQLSSDGVNWSTGYPLTVSTAAAGTSTVVGFAMFDRYGTSGTDRLNNIRWIRCARIRNPNAQIVTNIVLRTSVFAK